jgi:hypothetical protein
MQEPKCDICETTKGPFSKRECTGCGEPLYICIECDAEGGPREEVYCYDCEYASKDD